MIHAKSSTTAEVEIFVSDWSDKWAMQSVKHRSFIFRVLSLLLWTKGESTYKAHCLVSQPLSKFWYLMKQDTQGL